MSDALEAFDAIAPAGEPRLFVLGGMEELGAEAEMFHRALGRSLRLQPRDLVLVVGDHAAAVATGTLESGAQRQQIETFTSNDQIAARVADWKGSVFVKGSRRYQLEHVLDSNAVGAHG
jgi:UDP-N-acetylmuramyl pentapeptide synthase